MRATIFTLLVALTISSCGIFSSLNSNTSIKPKESFVLGNNTHGSFKTVMKNVGQTELKVYKAPINGGTHSPIVLKPQESATIKTDKNTALIIENIGDLQASVDLKVTGDLNLGMTYKNN